LNNDDLKVLLFKGKGDRAFCSGGDIKESASSLQEGEANRAKVDHFTNLHNVLIYHLAQCKQIQISIWDGIVMGAGVGVSIHSKIKIATEHARFAMPEARVGLFTDVGAGYFLSRLRNGIGMYLALTSRSLIGKDVVVAGLADYFVPRDKLLEVEKDIKEFTEKNGETVNKTALDDIVKKYSQVVEAQYGLEEFTKTHFTKDSLLEIIKSLEEAADKENDVNAKEVLKDILQNCPKSLRVTFELLSRGKSLSLKEVLSIESPAYIKINSEKDFFEGINAVLLSKGAVKPQWSHKSVADVTEEEVQSYFNLPKFDVDNPIHLNSPYSL
jgi:3-hydroxyisobutyryl-CoA hydrolase